MAKHQIPKKRRARKAALACAAAAGISGALVLGHATNTTAANFLVQLSNTVIGAGGQGDPTGIRVPDKLNRTVVPEGFDYYAVQYPATINLQASRDVGVPIMHTAIADRSDEDVLIVAAYSAGALISERVRRDLQALDPAEAPSPDQLRFLQIASPFAGNGGIYARFPGIGIPFITDPMGAGQPTRYDTEYHVLMYDTYGDFPAYFNPLSIANSLLAIRYGHPDAFYDSLVPGTSPAYVTTVHNTAGGEDTYVLYYNPHLPLLGPVRELAGLVFLTPFTEPVLGAVEPLLRLLVDMGYTDRVNANPATPTPFSFITPTGKILEALFGVPGALTQGATNLVNGGQAPTTLPDPLGNLVPAAPPVADTGSSSAAQLATVPDVEPEPEQELQPTATATPPASSPPAASAAASTPTPTAKPAGDGLHPTLTSDGNKVTPGEQTDTTPTTTGTGGATTTTTTTTTETDPTETDPADAEGPEGSEGSAANAA
jgi:hypothetical protein